MCRGLGTWRCGGPVFWPCSQELRWSTCTICRIWWVNQLLFSYCLGFLCILLVDLHLFPKFSDIRTLMWCAFAYLNNNNCLFCFCQSIPDIPPKPGELRTELLGHKVREEAAAELKQVEGQQKVDWWWSDADGMMMMMMMEWWAHPHCDGEFSGCWKFSSSGLNGCVHISLLRMNLRIVWWLQRSALSFFLVGDVMYGHDLINEVSVLFKSY